MGSVDGPSDFYARVPAAAAVAPELRTPSDQRPSKAHLVVIGVVLLIAPLFGLVVSPGWLVHRGPHGPSTGLQATTPLHVTFPTTVNGETLNPRVTISFANNDLGVPALAQSTQVEYQGNKESVIVAGGPLPAAFRSSGNADQVNLLKSILEHIGGGPARPVSAQWHAASAGQLGGQMWCGATHLPNLPAAGGSCWVVDSQNVLDITVIGDDWLSVANLVRPLVEVTGS